MGLYTLLISFPSGFLGPSELGMKTGGWIGTSFPPLAQTEISDSEEGGFMEVDSSFGLRGNLGSGFKVI